MLLVTAVNSGVWPKFIADYGMAAPVRLKPKWANINDISVYRVLEGDSVFPDGAINPIGNLYRASLLSVMALLRVLLLAPQNGVQA